MAAQPQPRRGRPAKSDEEKATRRDQIVIRLPDDDYAYLSYVVRELRRLGHSENEAARHIVIQEISRMRRRYPRPGD
jgi:hypothetical protein